MNLFWEYRFSVSYSKGSITDEEFSAIDAAIGDQQTSDDDAKDFIAVLEAINQVCSSKTEAFFDAVTADYPYLNTAETRATDFLPAKDLYQRANIR